MISAGRINEMAATRYRDILRKGRGLTCKVCGKWATTVYPNSWGLKFRHRLRSAEGVRTVTYCESRKPQ